MMKIISAIVAALLALFADNCAPAPVPFTTQVGAVTGSVNHVTVQSYKMADLCCFEPFPQLVTFDLGGDLSLPSQGVVAEGWHGRIFVSAFPDSRNPDAWLWSAPISP